MRYFDPERPDAGLQYSSGRVSPPTPSPVPLQRGVYKRPDPDMPGYVIAEIWTAAGTWILCSRMTLPVYLKRHRHLQAILDDEDPMTGHLRAV